MGGKDGVKFLEMGVKLNIITYILDFFSLSLITDTKQDQSMFLVLPLYQFSLHSSLIFFQLFLKLNRLFGSVIKRFHCI